eukprot:358236-Chlamydomonas_euryale.AAC.2
MVASKSGLGAELLPQRKVRVPFALSMLGAFMLSGMWNWFASSLSPLAGGVEVLLSPLAGGAAGLLSPLAGGVEVWLSPEAGAAASSSSAAVISSSSATGRAQVGGRMATGCHSLPRDLRSSSGICGDSKCLYCIASLFPSRAHTPAGAHRRPLSHPRSCSVSFSLPISLWGWATSLETCLTRRIRSLPVSHILLL